MQKYTPLIILAMFVVAAVVIIQGLNTADDLVHPPKTQKANP
jgi:hypothetical protein